MTNKLKKILAIEDHYTVRKLYETHVKKLGYSYDSAIDGTTAQVKIRENPPDLIILDVELPDMDGLSLLYEIHRQYPDIPVIVVSIYESLAELVREEDFGKVRVYPKPISYHKLKATLEELIGLPEFD